MTRPHRRNPGRAEVPTPRLPPDPPPPTAGDPRNAGSRTWLAAGLGLACALLLAHVWIYSFLCDDAFISFRYARNFAHGLGLVFNAGFERVEGYSNFLWVMLLAGFIRLGVPAEQAAPVLSVAATILLWGLVAARAARGARPPWTALVAPFYLALNRSFAVWGTSGLETRCFELLVVAGVLRLVDEVEGAPAGRRRVPLAPILFALATLTRPDGLLLSATAAATATALVARRAPGELGRHVLGWIPFAVIVGAHYSFRHSYYGDWLPNTYYAKVGGRTWWDAGFQYLAAFSLEYGLVVWVPFVAAGVGVCLRQRRGLEPALYAGTLLPYLIYITAIGGDHFEYRPLDLIFPFAALLIGRGVGWFASGGAPDTGAASAPARRSAAARAALAAGIGLLAVTEVELPWQSHRQFPARYLAGFPGRFAHESAQFLEPGRDLLHRLPPFSTLARWHRSLLDSLTRRFIGIRQEEHALFFGRVRLEGRRLREIVDAGLLPGDTYIATGSVGAIPYFSGLRTLDRLGLTDREVARSKPQATRIMAHDRSATLEDGRARGVDLWAAHDVHFLWEATSTQPIDLVLQGASFHAARLGPDEWLLAMFPRGADRAASRFPRLRFQDGRSESFFRAYLHEGVAALRDSVARHPGDDAAQRVLAQFLLAQGDFREAIAVYRQVLARSPDDERALLDTAFCLHSLGRDSEMRPVLEHLLSVALKHSNEGLARRAQALLDGR